MTTDADVWNPHTPRTEEAREAIKNQLENGHGVVETGDPTTSLNFDPVQLDVQERMKAGRLAADAANKAAAEKSPTKQK